MIIICVAVGIVAVLLALALTNKEEPRAERIRRIEPLVILTVTEAGVVSLLKNLTEDEARGCMQRLRRPGDRGNPWSDGALRERAQTAVRIASGNGSVHGWSVSISSGDLKTIECWGSNGGTLEVWPKPADADERYERFLAEERRVAA